MHKMNVVVSDLISSKVTIHSYVLCVFVENKVVGNMVGWLVVIK